MVCLLGGEESHSADGSDTLGQPFFLVGVGFIDQLVCLDIAMEVIRDQVVISVVYDAVDERGELVGVAERAFANGFEYIIEIRVELKLIVEMCMTEVFDVLGQITEQENVLFANLAGDLDLQWSV